VFDRCKFVGTRFVASIFAGCSFDGCDFSYAFFDLTIISMEQIGYSLPERPNVRRDLLKILRANAASIGDCEAQNKFISLELKARREYLSLAIAQRDSYYRKKYDTFTKKLKLYWAFITNFLEQFIWAKAKSCGNF